MSRRDLPARVAARAARQGLNVPPDVIAGCVAYLELLAKWNRTINLTGFDLDKLAADAIDRLVVEPVRAARHIATTDQLLIDIGSGSGSPSIPIKIARPWLRVVLVESKTRKAAFLREAARHLGFTDVEVEVRRAEELLTRAELVEAADIVTMRAVRMDDGLARTVAALLRGSGRLLWFGASPEPASGRFPLKVIDSSVGLAVFRRII